MSENQETDTPPEPQPVVAPTALPAPEPEPAPAPALREPARPRRTLWPAAFVLGFVVLAAGEGYLWHEIQMQTAQDAQFTGLQAQISALQAQANRAAPAPDSVTTQADLSMKYSALAAQVNAVQAQAAADHGALTSMQADATNLSQLTTRIALLNALENARMALDAGQPLGTVPGAPPALAQFAAAAPPTEAQLRLSFAQAAEAGDAASIAGNASGNSWTRVLARFENLITISKGGQVVFGAPAAGVIEQARTLLNAGDLAGAVAQLDTLSTTTQQAMAGWLAQARALLAARAALIALAGQA
ncbi:MAG: hypothetical protein B7X08_06870 [Acidocella sp. 20-63-7]|nr:MAG: hypothetical protein B7X08_06870 [Acidocella sp. 20-63-7]HQT45683.1 hypothetical protein [Acidocella sp.]